VWKYSVANQLDKSGEEYGGNVATVTMNATLAIVSLLLGGMNSRQSVTSLQTRAKMVECKVHRLARPSGVS
jgi:hypothetical protein